MISTNIRFLGILLAMASSIFSFFIFFNTMLNNRIDKGDAVVRNIDDAPIVKKREGTFEKKYIIYSNNRIDTIFSNIKYIKTSNSNNYYYNLKDINDFAFLNIEKNFHKWVFFSSAVASTSMLFLFFIIFPTIFNIIIPNNIILNISKIKKFGEYFFDFFSLTILLFIFIFPFFNIKNVYYIITNIKFIKKLFSIFVIIFSITIFIYYTLSIIPSMLSKFPVLSFNKNYYIFDIAFSKYNDPSNFIITIFTIIAAFPLIGILIILYKFIDIKNDNHSEKTIQSNNYPGEVIEMTKLSESNENIKILYSSLSKSLNILTLSLALLVSAATVSTGLQRETIISHSSSLEILCPPELTYLYGAAYSLLLIIISVPVYITMQSVGAKLGIDLAQAQKQSGQHWWDIGEKTIQQLKLALSVILPFLTSVIQEAIS